MIVGESGVKLRFIRRMAIMMAGMLWLGLCAGAEQSIGTTVVMRVSHMTQNAVVDAGEDLSIEVNVDGIAPDLYQWYFNGTAIEGANQRVLNIVNAQSVNTGLYRMDAYDAAGNMLVSMDIYARVLEDVVPQSGDASLPVGYAFAGMALCTALVALLLRRRARA